MTFILQSPFTHFGVILITSHLLRKHHSFQNYLKIPFLSYLLFLHAYYPLPPRLRRPLCRSTLRPPPPTALRRHPPTTTAPPPLPFSAFADLRAPPSPPSALLLYLHQPPPYSSAFADLRAPPLPPFALLLCLRRPLPSSSALRLCRPPRPPPSAPSTFADLHPPLSTFTSSKKLRHIREGDVVVLLARLYWSYNNANEPLVFVSLLDTSNIPNQLDQFPQ